MSNKEYYQKNKHKWVEYSKRWKANNPERVLEIARKFYWKHRHKIIGNPKKKAYLKAYCAAHKEELKHKHALYVKANREAHNARGRKWRQLNYSKNSARAAAYREKNRIELRRKNAEYKKRNPSKILAQRNRRRAIAEHPSVDFKKVEEFYEFIRSQVRIACVYCGTMVDGCKVHIDHVVPLSRGGLHCVSNLRASCPSCNTRKNNKLLAEWRPELVGKI